MKEAAYTPPCSLFTGLAKSLIDAQQHDTTAMVQAITAIQSSRPLLSSPCDAESA